GAVCTATAFVLFFKLIEEPGPARATVITYVNPAVAVALGVSVLGEPLTPAIAGAFVLILAGSVLATRAGARRGKTSPAPASGTASAPAGQAAPAAAGGSRSGGPLPLESPE
ncbi:MAG: DMT family transporter, partial [Actinobacteria bacterium]|nr:DMT family transporter [Actinomycetota bacterium]